MRGAGGAWRMVAHATWGDDAQVQAEQVFTGIVSPSEMYQNQVGFWIDPPRSLNYNFDMFNLDGAGGFHFEDWHYENGGGYVVFDNYRYTTIGVTFSDLDIHWRHGDLPADEAAVMTHVQNLAGPNHQEPDTPITDMVVKSTTFQGRGAWHVAGQWREAYVAQSGSLRPAEWLIFRCPGSEWLWTLVISADKAEYMTYLRTLQETFECPVVE